MMICDTCGAAMILVSFYDPLGEIPIYGMRTDNKGEMRACQTCGKMPLELERITAKAGPAGAITGRWWEG